MPAYVWECNQCKETTEVDTHIADRDTPPKKVCAKCGSSQFTRIIAKTNFSLAGGGWYKDGYSKTPQPKGD